MAEHILVKYDFGRFEWRDAPDVDGCATKTRPLAGMEFLQDVYHREMQGFQTLFFATYVDLAHPVSEKTLVDTARAAWVWLRFHAPTIALRIGFDEKDDPYFLYRTDTAAGIQAWADRTFRVERRDAVELVQLREEIGRARVPDENGDMTWMRLVPGPRDSDDRVARFGLLLHTHHGPFDGTALKILFSRFLARVAARLATPDAPSEALEWGTEFGHLPPAAFGILRPEELRPISHSSEEQPSFGHPYYGAVGGLLATAQSYAEKGYGFRARPAETEWPSTRHMQLAFTKAETESILRALKTRDGKTAYTFTQLAVAALAMTTVQEHPPTAAGDKERAIGFFTISNCRNRLVHPYNTKDGYVGYALGVGCQLIPMSLLLVADGQLLPADKHMLALVLKHVRTLYLAEKESSAQLSGMAVGVPIFAAMLKAAARAGVRPPAQGFSFSGDGVGEQYLDAEYYDAAQNPVLSISRFFTSLNVTDPGPFFRSSSWRGTSEIMVDYNSNVMTTADMETLMHMWKENILLVTSFEDAQM